MLLPSVLWLHPGEYFRYQLYDILPVALDTVTRSMRDGVIVLDNRDRIIELNPAAQQITGFKTFHGCRSIRYPGSLQLERPG